MTSTLIHLIPSIPVVIATVIAVKSRIKLWNLRGIKINVVIGDGRSIYCRDEETGKEIHLVNELRDIAISSFLAAVAAIIAAVAAIISVFL